MPLHLVTAPAGAGKTQYVIEQIRERSKGKLLPRVLIIAASPAQIAAFRERLGVLRNPTFGVTLTLFRHDKLYRDIVDAAGVLPRILPEPVRYRVVRAAVNRLAAANRIPYFAAIADRPGFYVSVGQLIGQLKRGLQAPRDLARISTAAAVRDLVTIYTEYEEFLRKRSLTDREGMGWLALRALDCDPNLGADYDYAAVDGFDEFDSIQLAILDRLGMRLPALDVTLTYQAQRLAHARFARTIERLANASRDQVARAAPPRSAPLEHLEQHLFDLNPPSVPAKSAVKITAAPDRAREVRAIGREVKRLLNSGVGASQIAVLFPRLDVYQDVVREAFAEYTIPFHVQSGLPLQSNPLVAALLNLLTLSVNDFPWRETVDALRSPYFLHRSIQPQAISQIEQIAREAAVVRGQSAWLAAFQKPNAPAHADESDTRLVTMLTEEEIAALRAQMDAFLRVSLPERASVRDFVVLVESLIGPDPKNEAWLRRHWPGRFHEDDTSLRVIERARAGEQRLAARDLAALDQLKEVLRSLLQAADILNQGPIEWAAFLADLREAVAAATYDLTPATEGRVPVSEIGSARGVPRDYVFLGGLVEGELPARPPEEPFLSASERDALIKAGVPLAALRARDARTLFYEAATLARTRLFLSFPYLDDDSNALYPSPYVQAVSRLFTDLATVRLPVTSAPQLQEAASTLELGVAVTLALAKGDPAARRAEAALARASRGWRNSLRARQIEARRESSAPFDEYCGVIQDPTLRASFAVQFGPQYLWSASKFNDWGACGFRFFARRLLALEEMAEPVEGLDARQLGALYHQILEETYLVFAACMLTVTPETLSEAQNILQDTAERLLADAPARYAFRPTAWWNEECGEIARRLKALLEAEAERNAGAACAPVEFEVPFGFKGKPPLRARLSVGATLIAGQIDRIDRKQDGVVLVDYKTGSTRIGPREVTEGRNLQLPVYVLAAQAQGRNVVDAYFVHIRSGETSGSISPGEREMWMNKAKEHMARYISLSRSGSFAVSPSRLENGVCTASCEFASLCRVGRWSPWKERALQSV